MIDFIAGGFDLSAAYVIGNKNRYGFILSFIGNAAWIYVAFKVPVYGLLLIVVPALLLNVRNFLKWRRR